MTKGHGLKKTVGLSAALSTVIGVVIGSGVFFKPQAIYSSTHGGPGLGIIAWILGGLITIAAGLTAAEVSAAMPETGGMMVYMREMYGEKLSFLTGWMQTVLYFPGIIASGAVIFGEQSASMLGNSHFKMPIAVGIIIFILILNVISSKFGGVIQTLATICKLLPLILIIIFGFIKGTGSNNIITPLIGPHTSIGAALGEVLIATLFAYDGWINVGAIAGEMRNPGKDLPKAIIGGLSIVMAVYLAINISYLWVVPASVMATVPSPASLVAQKIFGSIGGNIVSVGILISVFGNMSGNLLTGPRVTYALAEKKTIPFSKVFSKVNKGGVPGNAMMLTVVLAIIYALSGKFNLLTNLTIFTVWIFYIMIFAGVIKLRKTRPDMNRPYKVIGYPIIPIIAILGGAFVIINQLFMAGEQSTFTAIGGVIITLIGLPIYLFMKRKNELE
ncbi:APC family permease [Clostridium massiliamazoniense]|uniref:APC family permease n=1 Tax=Clostridium massiliamazoniense TaxID=1347366 RepID=UPI0006D85D9E|nr:amino acid permease [Clostridium massiliamazoniense]